MNEIIRYLENEFAPRLVRALEGRVKDWEAKHADTVVGKVVQAIERAAESLKDEGKRLTDFQESAQFNPFSKLEDEIKKALQAVGKTAQDAVNAARGSAIKAVTDAEGLARREVQTAEDTAINAIKAASTVAHAKLGDIEAAVTADARKVESLASNIAKSEFAKLAGDALNKAVAIAQDTAPDSLSVQVGPVVVTVDPEQDITALKAAALHPPHDRRTLLAFINSLATGGSIEVNVSAELSAVVVSSDSLAVGLSASWDAGTFVQRFEDIMNRIGF